MHRSALKIVLPIILVLSIVAPFAQEADEQRVIVKVRTNIEVEGRHSGHSATKITTVDGAKFGRIDLGEVYLMLSVMDERDSEYSVRLDLFDATGTVRDSISILTSDEVAKFSLSSEHLSVSGTISIALLE